jgi:hypothetical protein
MVDALRNAFAIHSGAVVCAVFAYRPNTDTENLFSLARAAASRDGSGWDGEGDLFGIGPDHGLAQIEIVDWDYTYGVFGNHRTYEGKVF